MSASREVLYFGVDENEWPWSLFDRHYIPSSTRSPSPSILDDAHAAFVVEKPGFKQETQDTGGKGQSHDVIYHQRIIPRDHADDIDQRVAQSNNAISEFDDEFKSAKSVVSQTTFYTASTQGEPVRNSRHLDKTSEYATVLEKKGLWPVDAMDEQNWSGRGQHAHFENNERHIVNDILQVGYTLGRTSTATVESVRCRRIVLARKTILCSKRVTMEQILEEVAHLTRLRHSHIVRVIGTYALGRDLSILMYPVADWNLDTFLRAVRNRTAGWEVMSQSAWMFPTCLSAAMGYIHSNSVKHLDIKPQNILVRKSLSDNYTTGVDFKVYITDFGIAKAYEDEKSAETDGWTSFTRKYASPEVVQQSLRGLSADIFSLGCVFLEICAHIFDVKLEGMAKDKTQPGFWNELQDSLHSDRVRDHAYHANIDAMNQLLKLWMETFPKGWDWTTEFLDLIATMLSEDPATRPKARDLVTFLGLESCCNRGPDELQAARTSRYGGYFYDRPDE